MYLVSMPRKDISYSGNNNSDPSAPRITCQGVCGCPLGHEIGPSVTKAEEKLMAFQKAYRKNEPKPETEAQIQSRKLKEYMEKRREEFDEKGIITALYGTVERKVKCASTCTDHLLVQRRNRLRELLLSEEVAYTNEYIAKCQEAAASKDEEMKRKAFDLKTKLERERQDLVQQKLQERKVQDCDPVRPILSQKALIEVKKDQLWQIQEKYAIEEAKREEEKMYHDLMIKNMLSLKENEEEQAKIAWQKQKALKSAFDEQMRWKQKKELEEQRAKDIERLKTEEEIARNKELERKEREERIKMNAKKNAEYLEYIKKEKELRERQKKEEEEIDAVFSKLGKIVLGNEITDIKAHKEKMKREMDAFLENCRELKRQKEIEDRKFDEMLEELNKMKRKQKEAERERLKAAKEELFNSVLKGREVQVREKREKEKREQQERAREIDLLNAQIEQQKRITEEYEKRCLEQKQNYAKQLFGQIKQVEQSKKLQKEEQENYLKELKAEEERRLEEIKEILKLPVHPRPHPMKQVIQQNITPNYVCPFPCPK